MKKVVYNVISPKNVNTQKCMKRKTHNNNSYLTLMKLVGSYSIKKKNLSIREKKKISKKEIA